MRVDELSAFLSTKFNYPFYNNDFPPNQNPSELEAGIVKLFPLATTSQYLNDITCQIIVQSKRMDQAESKSWEIYEFFRFKTSFDVGSTHVVVCRAAQPTYLTANDSGLFMYSVSLQIKSEV